MPTSAVRTFRKVPGEHYLFLFRIRSGQWLHHAQCLFHGFPPREPGRLAYHLIHFATRRRLVWRWLGVCELWPERTVSCTDKLLSLFRNSKLWVLPKIQALSLERLLPPKALLNHSSLCLCNIRGVLDLADHLSRGRLVKDRTSNQPKLNCRNWECGVIIPVPAGDGILGSNDKDQDPPGMDIFQGTVPVPMIVPGEEYGGRKPWFYSEQQ